MFFHFLLKVTYGDHLETVYNNTWVCSVEATCQDVCIATAQLKVDTVTLTAEIETLAPTRKSDLAILQFINPETFEVESLMELSSPIEVTLALYEPLDMDSYDYKVHSIGIMKY